MPRTLKPFHPIRDNWKRDTNISFINSHNLAYFSESVLLWPGLCSCIPHSSWMLAENQAGSTSQSTAKTFQIHLKFWFFKNQFGKLDDTCSTFNVYPLPDQELGEWAWSGWGCDFSQYCIFAKLERISVDCPSWTRRVLGRTGTELRCWWCHEVVRWFNFLEVVLGRHMELEWVGPGLRVFKANASIGSQAKIRCAIVS